MNILVQIYQDKQIREFLHKLFYKKIILQEEDDGATMFFIAKR